jgi:hypothetical protein
MDRLKMADELTQMVEDMRTWIFFNDLVWTYKTHTEREKRTFNDKVIFQAEYHINEILNQISRDVDVLVRKYVTEH